MFKSKQEEDLSNLVDKFVALSTCIGESYRIVWRGKAIITNSGKASWTTIGAAKNAFRHHLNSFSVHFTLPYYKIKHNYPSMTYPEFYRCGGLEEVYQDLLKEVSFVKVNA